MVVYTCNDMQMEVVYVRFLEQQSLNEMRNEKYHNFRDLASTL